MTDSETDQAALDPTARRDRVPRQRLDPEARRASILTAAEEAFGTQSYEQVSLAAVARAAGASEALVHKYFDGKAGLHAAVTQAWLDGLLARQLEAEEALPEGTSTRDRVRASLVVYLDVIAESPQGWAGLHLGSTDPQPAREVRRAARAGYLATLRELLPGGEVRRDYALRGFFGFLDAACLAWVERGCPENERWSLIDAALGALEGSIGDWGG